MVELNSAEYYRNRERQERALARAANNPEIAAIHSQMADRYCELISRAEPRHHPSMQLSA